MSFYFNNKNATKYIIGLLLLMCIEQIKAQYLQRCPDIQYSKKQKEQQLQFNHLVEEYLNKQKRKTKENNKDKIYFIPVIFHIIHTGEAIGKGTNISNRQVYSQIDILNEDFNNENLDKTEILSDFSDVVGNPQIRFFAVSTAPDGSLLSEHGINRIKLTQSKWDIKSFLEQVVKDNYWNPKHYCNIWILDIRENILGYAQLPSESGLPGLLSHKESDATDGILVNYKTVGRPPYNSFDSNYNLGRTLTHEMGHWLGLFHLWGIDRDCDKDDFCQDTPPMEKETFGCPRDPLLSCGNIDMNQNFMGYVDDACMHLFTKDQVARMCAVLEIARNRIELSSSSAFPVSGIVAAFGVEKTEVCIRSILQFQDKSLIKGNNLNFTYEWHFEGGIPEISTEKNPSITYNTTGIYDVKLFIHHAKSTDTLFKEKYINVIDYNQITTDLPLIEEFETNDIENITWENKGGWKIINVDREGVMQSALAINNFRSTQKTKDKLISPVISTDEQKNLILSFDFAYAAHSDQSETDSLIIGIKDICQDKITHIWQISAGEITTAPSTEQIFEVNNNQWENILLPLGRIQETYIQVIITNINAGANRLYIDKLSIRSSETDSSSDVNIFPNPSKSFVNIYTTNQNIREIRVYNTAGAFIQNIQCNQNNIFWNIRQYKAGLYIVKIMTETDIFIKKLFISK